MSKEYPAGYTGPKAGQSPDEEWIAVRDYQVYKWIREGIWTYSDFDCYLVAKCREHYNKGGDSVHNALKNLQRSKKNYERIYRN